MQKVFPISFDNAQFLSLDTFQNPTIRSYNIGGLASIPDNAKAFRDDIAIQIVDPEFSSVCPKTGLPDYGTVILEYVPDELCVELKSWKLFLRCFYGVGAYHEACTDFIAKKLVEAINPVSMRLTINWGARGGLHTTTSMKFCKYRQPAWGSDGFDHEAFGNSTKWTNR